MEKAIYKNISIHCVLPELIRNEIILSKIDFIARS